jgi:hypothetical protein
MAIGKEEYLAASKGRWLLYFYPSVFTSGEATPPEYSGRLPFPIAIGKEL